MDMGTRLSGIIALFFINTFYQCSGFVGCNQRGLVRPLSSMHVVFGGGSQNAPAPCEDMCSWLLESGATINGIEVGVEGGGYGLKTSKSVKKGYILLELKPQSLLTYGVGSSKKEGILIEAINEVPEELWSARLGLKLLAERTNPDSDYWPYVRQLPAAFGGVPLFFSPEEVEALQYPPLQAQVRKRGLFLNDFAKDTLPKYSEAFNGVSLDINALGWAMTAVSSRAFRLG
ncbi:unnamed protein product, partial [Heterosigma akashiwo]